MKHPRLERLAWAAALAVSGAAGAVYTKKQEPKAHDCVYLTRDCQSCAQDLRQFVAAVTSGGVVVGVALRDLEPQQPSLDRERGQRLPGAGVTAGRALGVEHAGVVQLGPVEVRTAPTLQVGAPGQEEDR